MGVVFVKVTGEQDILEVSATCTLQIDSVLKNESFIFYWHECYLNSEISSFS